jgi:N-acetylglucosaminyldiphosphoundecaprenol N-acetyl-beta-D-mannosaminyltransferase
MQLLGVRIDNILIDEALEKIEGFLNDGRQHYIVLPYAEFLVEARQDKEFCKILNKASLSLSDGFGPILFSPWFGEPLKGRVMGVDLVEAIFDKFWDKHSFFLYGAREGTAQATADKFLQKHPFTKIRGTQNGFGDEKEALEKIKKAAPEILFIALGMPKQEKWIAKNLKKLPSVKLAIGVGGSFDFISGRTRRAPKPVQKIGMEWLWRTIIYPKRIKKTWRSVGVFSYLAIKEKFKL